MRIGVDGCCWANKRGYGRFTRELLTAFLAIDDKNNYWFFIDKETASTNKFPEGMKIIVASTLVSPLKAASASGRRSLRDVWNMSQMVMKHDLDLFFFPSVYSYFPIFNRTKIVLTIHDMIADRHPDEVFSKKKHMLFWKLKQYLAVKQAHLILTVSEFSKRQIITDCKVPQSRMCVISEAPSHVFTVLPKNGAMSQVLCRYQLDSAERFLLYVGGISPHKNLRTLIESFHSLLADPKFSDLKLILVGDYLNDPFYSDYPALKLQVSQLHLTRKVIFTGFVEDCDLAYLYNAASLLVFPSLEEGFGLPAIEAMACGTPVAASDAGSLPEILGQAGRFFDPHRSSDILNVMKLILSNNTLRKEMSRAGLIRAKQFSWDVAAKATLSLFDDLVKK